MWDTYSHSLIAVCLVITEVFLWLSQTLLGLQPQCLTQCTQLQGQDLKFLLATWAAKKQDLVLILVFPTALASHSESYDVFSNPI